MVELSFTDAVVIVAVSEEALQSNQIVLHEELENCNVLM